MYHLNIDPKDAAVPIGLDFDSFYSVRRSHQYGDNNLSVGQLMKLNPQASKNEQLVRLGFLVPVPKEIIKKKLWSECGRCGEKFISSQARDNHVRDRHIAPKANIPTIDELPPDKAEALINAPLTGERIRDGEGLGPYVRDGASVMMDAPSPDGDRDSQAPVFFENTVASQAAGVAPTIKVRGAKKKPAKKGLRFDKKRGDHAELR